MDYAQRIRDLREDADLKQSEVARIINKSQQCYSHIENRKVNLYADDLRILCMFYNVSADYILGFTNDKKPLPKK